MELDWTHGEKN